MREQTDDGDLTCLGRAAPGLSERAPESRSAQHAQQPLAAFEHRQHGRALPAFVVGGIGQRCGCRKHPGRPAHERRHRRRLRGPHQCRQFHDPEQPLLRIHHVHLLDLGFAAMSHPSQSFAGGALRRYGDDVGIDPAAYRVLQIAEQQA